jgi:hypothetical protein
MLVDTASEKPETYSRNSKEPRTIKEAMKMSDRDQWKQAVKDELNTPIEMGTWKLVPLPKGRKAVGCRMVLKRKFNLDGTGTVSRWNARAVLKGYAQREHIDYGWIGQQSGSGFCDRPPATLGVFASLDRF